MSNQLDITLDDVFKTTPLGSIENAIGNNFYGINHRQYGSVIPVNKETHGFTFFTRPQLNLSTPNLRSERTLTPLLTLEPRSIQRIIRCLLDPRIAYRNPNMGSPFVDNENAFFPILTNNLLTCGSWPDPTISTFTSKQGAYKEEYGFTDSYLDQYSSYDLTCTFRNTEGDPITSLIYTWIKYQAFVGPAGILSPYFDFITKFEIDYNTRIYSLVMDKTRQYVNKIDCCGAAHPLSVSLGTQFNYQSEVPLNMTNQIINVNFRCYGHRPYDDINIVDFNDTVKIFNPSMRDEYRNSNMVLIPYELLVYFNNRGYPRINEKTGKLEWYIPKELYNTAISNFNKTNKSIEENNNTSSQMEI